MVQPLGWEDPMEKEVANHSSILDCKIPWTEEPGLRQSIGSQRVRIDLATKLNLNDVFIRKGRETRISVRFRMYMKVLVTRSYPNLWTVACQAPLSMEFSRQDLVCISLWILPNL